MTLEFDANGRFPSDSCLENKFSWWYSWGQIEFNISPYLVFGFFNAYNQVFIIESMKFDSTNTIWNPEIRFEIIYFIPRRPGAYFLCLSVRPSVCLPVTPAVSGVRGVDECNKLSAVPRTLVQLQYQLIISKENLVFIMFVWWSKKRNPSKVGKY